MSLLSNIYNRPKIGGVVGQTLQAYGDYNTQYGVPMAVNSAQYNNFKTAAASAAEVEKLNKQVTDNLLAQINGFNSGAASFASNQSQAANQRASDWSTGAALSINQQAADFASGNANRINTTAAQQGASGAISSGQDLNLFSTLNSAYLNNNIAVPAANQAASQFNRSATGDVLDAMGEMFGSREGFDQFRSQVNSNISDKLKGKVSQSTRRQLARQAISSGNTELGDQAVGDFYTGYLGQTSEQLQAQGQNQYESLYGLYRQSVPLTSGAQLLPQYGLGVNQISSQAHSTAGNLMNMGGVSAQQLFGATGLQNSQLYQTNSLNASQLYQTNALQSSQIYGTNSLSNASMFGANAVSAQGLLPLTTMSPGEAIGHDQNYMRLSQGGGSGGGGNAVPSQSFTNFGTPGSGPGMGLSGTRFDTRGRGGNTSSPYSSMF